MKRIYVVSIILFLFGCNSSVSNEPIKEEKQIYDFILSIETDKSVYEEEDTIEIFSYFKYVGEEIQFDQGPLISIVIENMEDRSIVKQVNFNDIQKTMKKGDIFSQTIKDLKLEKGEYQLYVATSSFRVGSNTYLIITTPREIEVK